MGSPISIGEAIALVSKVVSLYRSVKEWPKKIDKIADKMEGLGLYLLDIQTLTEKQALAQLQSQQRFVKVIRDIQEDAEDVHYILDVYNTTGTVLQSLFPLGKHPRQLENLMTSIDENRIELNEILQMQQSFATASVTLPPAPAQQPSKTNFSVIFVDPSNLGRSKVAEGYTKILGEVSKRVGARWPIKYAHSAGMGLRNRSDCIDLVQSSSIMNLYISYGNKEPATVAMASLFDNKRFEAFKSTIMQPLSQARSRGINQNVFQIYDYILVFVDREYSNLLRLKKQLLKDKGRDIAPRHKGRVVHLGSYLSKSDKPLEILDPAKNKDGTDNRANWNATTGQIKLATRTFLTRELGWVEPPKTT